MKRRPWLTVGRSSLVVLGLLTLHCGGRGGSTAGESAPAATSSAAESTGSVSIEFRVQPDPPRAGENRLEVAVRQPDHAPVTDAAVTAVFSMPAMPAMNMPAMRSSTTLTHESSGIYRGTGSLSMAGTWNVAVTVSRGDQELGQKRFSVVAK
jgi:YtkA-like